MSVQPRPQFFQVPLRRKIRKRKEEDLEGDLNKILGRRASGTLDEQMIREAVQGDNRVEGRNCRTSHSTLQWRFQLTRSQSIGRKRKTRLRKRLGTKKQRRQ